MSADPLEGFVHNYTGMTLAGRMFTICAACRKEVGALVFYGIGHTIRPCDKCGAKAGWLDRPSEPA